MQRTERDLLKVHRLEGRQWQDRIQDELWEACRLNQSAEKWRLSRILAGTQMGAKRRRLNVPAAEIPTVREWAQQMRKTGPDGGCEGETVRAGPTTDIPPERDGFIHVTGANRKGWTSTQHKPQYGMQDTNHATKANQRHFLRTGSDWHQTRDEQPTQDTNTTIRKRRPWEKPRRNVQASRYRDGVRKRFETRKSKNMFRRMKYRKAVPRGSPTKETWQMLLDDVDEFEDTIEYVWNRFHEHQILPRQ